MTWFRAEAGIARHEIIGALAEALHVRLHEAAGLYVFTLAGFADFQVDGNAAAITDTTLEQWALWRGKTGKYATCFRRLCLEDRAGQRDAIGIVRGWWRQEALLREQQRSRNRPGQGSREAPAPNREGTGKAPEQTPPDAAVPSRGNVDVDGTTTTTTTARAMSPAVGSPQHLALAERMTQDRYRSALEGYLRAAHDPPRLLEHFELMVNGLAGPGGRPVDPDVLGAALNAMAIAGAKPTEKIIAAFVLRELEPAKAPSGNGKHGDAKTAGTLATMERFRQRHGVSHA